MPALGGTLLIADDHALVREGLRTMLSGEVGLEVIARSQRGQQISPCVRTETRSSPHGREDACYGWSPGHQEDQAEMPKTSVMMVTMHENPDYLFEAVKAGAAEDVLKDASGRGCGAVRRTLEE